MLVQVAEAKCSVGVLFEHPQHHLKPVCLQPVVRGQEAEQLSIGMKTREGEMLNKLQMTGRLDQAKPGVGKSGKKPGTSVRRVVVRYDDFKLGVRLDQYALDAAAQIFFFLVEYGNDEGNEGLHVGGLCPEKFFFDPFPRDVG